MTDARRALSPPDFGVKMLMKHAWTELVLLLLAAACLSAGAVRGEDTAAGKWPCSGSGLVFSFESGSFRTPILALDQAGKEILAYQLKVRERARYDRNFALAAAKGSFVAEKVEPYLLDALKASGAFTVEAYLTPPATAFAGPGEIISFSAGPEDLNFALVQEAEKLWLSLRTGAAGAKPAPHRVALCAWPKGQAGHLAVSYTDAGLRCYKDGVEVLRSQEITGALGNWTACHLVFGDNWAGGRNWPGVLEGIALFNRPLTPAEIQAAYKWYAAKVAQRKPVAALVVKGKLIARTKIPEIEEMGTYFRALVNYEYEVESVLEGKYAEKTIRVLHFGVMDRKVVPEIAERPVGKSFVLRLEAVDDNPQLMPEKTCDEIPLADLPPFYDVEP